MQALRSNLSSSGKVLQLLLNHACAWPHVRAFRLAELHPARRGITVVHGDALDMAIQDHPLRKAGSPLCGGSSLSKIRIAGQESLHSRGPYHVKSHGDQAIEGETQPPHVFQVVYMRAAVLRSSPGWREENKIRLCMSDWGCSTRGSDSFCAEDLHLLYL